MTLSQAIPAVGGDVFDSESPDLNRTEYFREGAEGPQGGPISGRVVEVTVVGSLLPPHLSQVPCCCSSITTSCGNGGQGWGAELQSLGRLGWRDGGNLHNP